MLEDRLMYWLALTTYRSMSTQPEPYRDVLRRILAEYNKKPKGWHVLVAKARGMGHDVYVFRPEGTMAMLKLESLSVPNPVGVGVEVMEGEDMLRSITERGSHPFGLRPVPFDDLAEILKGAGTSGSASGKLFVDLMKREPMPASSIKTPFLLEGPVMRLRSTLHAPLVSPGQRDLDAMLQSELEKLVRRTYGPAYTG